eukprot:Sdes_comp23926_c0_seq1m22035
MGKEEWNENQCLAPLLVCVGSGFDMRKSPNLQPIMGVITLMLADTFPAQTLYTLPTISGVMVHLRVSPIPVNGPLNKLRGMEMWYKSSTRLKLNQSKTGNKHTNK